MSTLSYHIVVRTPVGVRIGDISLDFEGDAVRGVLEVPFFEQDFRGIINSDDTMCLYITLNENGKIQQCECTGRISSYAIHISVPTEAFTYEIDGTVTRAK